MDMIGMQGVQPAGQGSQGATDTSQGIVIEISCLPNGEFSVSSEPLQQEAQEEQGEDGSEAGQTAKNFAGAIKLAAAIYQDMVSGQAPSDEQLGFNSAQGKMQ